MRRRNSQVTNEGFNVSLGGDLPISRPKSPSPFASRLPAWKAVVYSLGSFASTMLTTLIVTWLLYYATGSHEGTSGGGVGHGVFGLAMAVGRIADAVADPFIGRWSDRTRSRLGRRLPFVLGGAIPMGAVFMMLWIPYTGVPVLLRAVRLALTLVVFFALYTVVVCPYLAMLPEIASDSATRVKLSSIQAAASIAGGGVTILLSARLYDRIGVPGGNAILGAIAVLCYLLVGLAFLRGPRREDPVRTKDGERGGVREPIAAAWRLVTGNPAFGRFLLGFAALWIGLNMVSISLPYLVTAVLGRPPSDVATLGLYHIAGTAVAIPLVSRVAARTGKVLALRGAALALAMCLPLTITGPAGTLAAIILAGPALAFVYTLPAPILAEITDVHRGRHGDGEEALHFGAQGLALKGALAIAAWLSGLLFSQLGAHPEMAWGPKSVGLLAGVLCGLAAWFLGRIGHLLGPTSYQRVE